MAGPPGGQAVAPAHRRGTGGLCWRHAPRSRRDPGRRRRHHRPHHRPGARRRRTGRRRHPGEGGRPRPPRLRPQQRRAPRRRLLRPGHPEGGQLPGRQPAHEGLLRGARPAAPPGRQGHRGALGGGAAGAQRAPPAGHRERRERGLARRAGARRGRADGPDLREGAPLPRHRGGGPQGGPRGAPEGARGERAGAAGDRLQLPGPGLAGRGRDLARDDPLRPLRQRGGGLLRRGGPAVGPRRGLPAHPVQGDLPEAREGRRLPGQREHLPGAGRAEPVPRRPLHPERAAATSTWGRRPSRRWGGRTTVSSAARTGRRCASSVGTPCSSSSTGSSGSSPSSSRASTCRPASTPTRPGW